MEVQVVRDGVILHVIPLGAQPLYIGRAPENGLVIADQTVSSNHASMWIEGGAVWLKDLGSRNGTFVNDQRIKGAMQVHPGNAIRLGPDMELRLHGEEAGGAEFLALIVEDQVSKVQFPIRGERFRIGGADDDHLTIPDAEPALATLLVYDDGEVYLGGDEGEEQQLKAGDAFEVAGRTFKLLALAPTYTATVEAEQAQYPYILNVTLDGISGPEAMIIDERSQRSHRVDAENRAILLYVLGKQWLVDKEKGLGRTDIGWCSDSDVSVGIWGRRGTTDANALHVLTHRLRKELKKNGFDPWFIEKRRRALRIRVKSVNVS